MRLGIAAGLLLATLYSCVPAAAAELPHKHRFQATLRDYIDRFEESDFEVELRPLDLQPSYLPDREALYRFWVLFGEGQRSVPPVGGMRGPAGRFVLSAIESGKAVNLDAVGVAPEALAWWSAWDYPGNPYRDSAAVRKRALVAAIVDMLMLDHAHERGKYRRSDFLGGSLIRLAYTYLVLKPHLPAEVRAAYETGLLRFLGRLEKWGPTGIHADMDMFALVGLWYLGKAVDNAKTRLRAKNHAKLILERHLKPAGYVDHGGGYDPSYNGISLYYVTWAAMISDWEFVHEGLERMVLLKAHTAFPEPSGGRLLGPTHFATTMSPDAAHDQWARNHREIALAMLSDNAAYLLARGHPQRGENWGIPDELRMRDEIVRKVAGFSRSLHPRTSKHRRTKSWREGHWCRSLNFAHDHYKSGTHGRFARLATRQSPLLSVPLDRTTTSVRLFGGEMLVARTPRFAVMVHAGRLSWWKGLSGFGGGALSALWTPEAGCVVLGRSRNRPYPETSRDSWANFEQWQTNAVSGRGANGKAFSSARIRRPQVKQFSRGAGQTLATVSVNGSIGPGVDRGRRPRGGGTGSGHQGGTPVRGHARRGISHVHRGRTPRELDHRAV